MLKTSFFTYYNKVMGEQLKKLCSKLNHTRMKNSTTLTWILRDSN